MAVSFGSVMFPGKSILPPAAGSAPRSTGWPPILARRSAVATGCGRHFSRESSLKIGAITALFPPEVPQRERQPYRAPRQQHQHGGHVVLQPLAAHERAVEPVDDVLERQDAGDRGDDL